jgi:hypothetical protein
MLAAESRQNSYDDSKRIDECGISWRPVRWYSSGCRPPKMLLDLISKESLVYDTSKLS